jgi:putative FmdB family regulatory protein
MKAVPMREVTGHGAATVPLERTIDRAEQSVPKYQYQCKDCGEALEVQQSFTDDALTVCPTCGGDLRKVFNAVGVVFKGSGFYKTDSRSGSSSTTSTSSTSAKSDASSSSGSSDKPAAKSESAPAKKSGDSAA